MGVHCEIGSAQFGSSGIGDRPAEASAIAHPAGTRSKTFTTFVDGASVRVVGEGVAGFVVCVPGGADLDGDGEAPLEQASAMREIVIAVASDRRQRAPASGAVSWDMSRR
jgi:hypothetical protein